MLLMMLERGENVTDIVFFDTGWEFPAMYDHLEKVEKFTGRVITRLKPREPFDYLLAYKKSKTGRIGGWPHVTRRWCTKEKVMAIERYEKALTHIHALPIVSCIGFAADEQSRSTNHVNKNKETDYMQFSFPLVEYAVREAQALEYCYKRGFDWGGLYKVFDRVSCFCCPLGGISRARKIWRHFPELWERMLHMERGLPDDKKIRRYINELSLSDLQSRFVAEDSLPLFESVTNSNRLES